MAPRPSSPHAYLVAGVVLALALLASVFLPLWQPLVLACVLAAALARLQDGLARRLGGRRSLAAGLLTAAVIVLVLAPLLAVAGLLVKEAIELAQQLQATFQERGLDGMVALLPDALQGWARQAIDRLPQSWDGLVRRAAAQAASAAGFLSGALSAALTGTTSALFASAMMLVALFFLLVDGHGLVAWLVRVSPLGDDATAQVMDDLRRTGNSVLTSIVATAAVQGVVSGVGYWIAGVSQPVLFALVTFFAAFIPSVGTGIVALPIAAVLLVTGHLAGGIFLAAWALLVTGTIDNVLKPVLARGGVQIHGGVIFFAMIGGIVVYGALGLVVGPLAVSLFLALVRAARREARRERGGEALVVPARREAALDPAARHDA